MKQAFVTVAFLLVFAGEQALAAQNKAPQAAQQAGVISGEVKDDQGHSVIRYHGIVPKELPPQKSLGLILGLHGRGGDEKQQVGPISQSLAACKLSRDYVILGLKAKGESWEDADIEPICKAIAWALKEYPIDPRRVFSWGYSSGAFGTGKLVPHHQELLAGGIMLAGGLYGPPKNPDGSEAAAQMYLIHGEKDQTVAVKTGIEACEHLKAANYRYVFRELIGADHGVGGPGSLPAKHDAIRWANALRNRLIPLTEAERKTVDEVVSKLKDPKASLSQTVFMKLADLAGPDVDAALVLALQSEKRDARMGAALLCQQRLYGKPVLTALPELLKDKDSQLRAAALRALGFAANFQYSEACEALSAFAKDPAAAASERVNAAGQLGLTVPLQLFCVNHDSVVFNTLTELLEDKNPQFKLIAKLSLDGKLAPDGQGFKIEK